MLPSRFHLTWFTTLFFCFSLSSAMAQLNEGEIMFVGFNADGSNGFAVVTLVDIPASSTIYFSDNEWNGSAIGGGGAFNDTGEGILTWTTPASIIGAGSIITFEDVAGTETASTGTAVVSGTMNLADISEVVYAYEGSSGTAPTTFLSAISNSGFSVANGQLTNTGLTAGTNAISLTNDDDVIVYNGSNACSGTFNDCTTQIATPGNWVGEDGAGDESQNTTIPDFPDDITGSFSGTALPVLLVSFTHQWTEQQVPELQWKTVAEWDHDYFEVYRAWDGIHYDRVGQVKTPTRISNPMRTYHFADRLAQGRSAYYKLRQLDVDGTEWWSAAMRVEPMEVPFGVTMYPNPSTERFWLLPQGCAVERVVLVNLVGATITQWPGQPESQAYRVPPVAKGLYQIIVYTDQGLQKKTLAIR